LQPTPALDAPLDSPGTQAAKQAAKEAGASASPTTHSIDTESGPPRIAARARPREANMKQREACMQQSKRQ